MRRFLANVKGGQGTRWVPWRTLFLSVAAVGVFFFGSSGVQSLTFDKTLILQGQFWRLITGHFVHFNFDHLFWDVLAFAILGTIIEKDMRRHVLPSLAVSGLFVSAWLIIGQQQVNLYYGLSGALNGWLIIAALHQWRKSGDLRYLLVIIGAVVKIGYEITTQRPIFIDPSTRTLPGSHVAGMLGGLCYYAAMSIMDLGDIFSIEGLTHEKM